MPRDLIVIGGSAGALQPLVGLVRALPPTLPAALFVVIHTSPDAPGTLPLLLGNGSALSASYARDGDPIRHGHVCLAPPDHHLLLDEDGVRVVHGPRENGFRPAVDPLFRTAARTFGPRVIGIVLSGGLDDGTNGLALVKRHGGLAVVQHPDDAFVNSMPLNAVRNVVVDHVVPAADLPALVLQHVLESKEGAAPMPKSPSTKADRTVRGRHGLEDGSLDGPASGFTCPECGGALWELSEGDVLRYACHVGHSYSPNTLLDGKAEQLEPVLWTALRALEENAAVYRRMADRSESRSHDAIASGYRAKAAEIEGRADVLRELLVNEKSTEPA